MKTVGEVMTREVQSVGPQMKLTDLDRALMEARVSGFPVLDGVRLVGVVSRSDVVRALSVEQTHAETVSEFYVDLGAYQAPPGTLTQIAEQVGVRLADKTVADVMHHDPLSVEPDTSLSEAAQILVSRRVHRLPVVREGALVGMITALDFVKLVADGTLQSA